MQTVSFYFLQALFEDRVLYVTFTIKEKEVPPGFAFGRTALDLGEIDFSFGKGLQDLIKGSRSIRDTEKERGLIFPCGGRGLPTYDPETGYVAFVVLDVFGYYL